MMLDLKKLSPAWWGAIAGAIAAGATLLPAHRLLGGLGGGVAMLVVAKKVSAPCCAACAEAAAGASSGTDTASTDASAAPPLFARDVPSSDLGAYTGGGCSTCTGGAAPTMAPHPADTLATGTGDHNIEDPGPRPSFNPFALLSSAAPTMVRA